jgi:hypothetical protein
MGYRWKNIIKITDEKTGSNSVECVIVAVVRMRRTRLRYLDSINDRRF